MLHKDAISISKKPMEKSRQAIILSKDIVFYHKATAGQTVINLQSLTMPPEITATQATTQQILSANLYHNKSLKLSSSLGVELMQDLHFKILSGTSIQLIGPYAGVGAEEGEIFRGVMPPLPLTDLIAASTKSIIKGYTLPVGENLVNLGVEYKTGVNPESPIGSIKVWINGYLAERNTDNSSTVLDKDYYEVPGANGYGVSIYVNVAPVSIPHNIVVDYGVNTITDVNAFNTLEVHAGILKKIAEDLALVAGTDPLDYMAFSPSEIERKIFADSVASHTAKLAGIASTVAQHIVDTTKVKFQTKVLGANTTAQGTINDFTFNNLQAGKKYRISGAVMFLSGTNEDPSITLYAPGTNLIGSLGHDTTITGTLVGYQSINIVFMAAVNGSLIVNKNNASGQVLNDSHLTLEELPNHEVTTQWT